MARHRSVARWENWLQHAHRPDARSPPQMAFLRARQPLRERPEEIECVVGMAVPAKSNPKLSDEHQWRRHSCLRAFLAAADNFKTGSQERLPHQIQIPVAPALLPVR